MEIPGLSTKALKQNYDENRYKYNGIEYDTAFGLDYYEAFYRDLDPQIGRWTTIDPKIDDGQESVSPYASMNNNPVKLKDPKGDVPCCEFAGQFWQTTQETAAGIVEGSGGVPNVVADVAAAAVEVVGTVGTAIIAAVEFFSENTPAAPVPAMPATPPASPSATQAPAQTQKAESKNSNSGNNQGSGEGRGKNDRKPDSQASGDHTVSNNRGSTTYQKNDKNPSGFQETKRVDTKGASHNGVETPHVHEGGKVRPATEKDIPKTDLSKNKPAS